MECSLFPWPTIVKQSAWSMYSAYLLLLEYRMVFSLSWLISTSPSCERLWMRLALRVPQEKFLLAPCWCMRARQLRVRGTAPYAIAIRRRMQKSSCFVKLHALLATIGWLVQRYTLRLSPAACARARSFRRAFLGLFMARTTLRAAPCALASNSCPTHASTTRWR